MERRQFTREFKLEAVRLIKERGVSYAQVSKDLGVPPHHARRQNRPKLRRKYPSRRSRDKLPMNLNRP